MNLQKHPHLNAVIFLACMSLHITFCIYISMTNNCFLVLAWNGFLTEPFWIFHFIWQWSVVLSFLYTTKGQWLLVPLQPPNLKFYLHNNVLFKIFIISFSCPISLSRISSVILNRIGKTGYLFLFSSKGEKYLVFYNYVWCYLWAFHRYSLSN